MTITKMYRSIIYFNVNGTKDDVMVIEEICDKALQFGHKLYSCETNSGGPCWGAYLTAEDSSEKKLTEYEGKIERYINLRKGAKIL